MTPRASPFRPATVAGLLVVGAGAFLLLLYALGAGWTGNGDHNGGAHAGSNALNGYGGLVELLRARGHAVTLSRSPAALDDENLLVVTPGQYADAAEIERLIDQRAYRGPTIVILPKWAANPVPDDARIETRDGWVVLTGLSAPAWLADVDLFEDVTLGQGETRGWSGLGLAGKLPDPARVQAIEAQGNTLLVPLVIDAERDILAGYVERNGYHPVFADAAGMAFDRDAEAGQRDDLWPLVIVAEPDLLDNYGLADRQRALLAVSVIEASMDGYEDLPVVFDMTLPGLGNSENLLTLAFRPPFLAATLCLLFVALVIAWRGFHRFGPPRAEAPAIAQGKRQLARNGAALIERAHRWHLLGEPYIALVAERIASALHIGATDPGARENAIDAAMAHRAIDGPDFSTAARTLRTAGRPVEIVRAAAALRTIERMLTR